jgi:hypothetical protein
VIGFRDVYGGVNIKYGNNCMDQWKLHGRMERFIRGPRSVDNVEHSRLPSTVICI